MHSQSGSIGSICFDGIEIDVDGHRLRVDGADVALERKAFTVLVLLARQPGRVFSRQEILDTVWGHVHVTPGVLNRIVTLVRQALGDSAETHRYLHTVHGVGYRFDLPATSTTSATANVVASTQAEAPLTAAIITDAAGGSTKPTASHRVRAAAWAIPLLVLLALAGWKLWTNVQSAPSTNSAPVAERSVAVLPLVNAGGDPEQQFFADGISENLIEALSKLDGLHVIGRISSFQFRNAREDTGVIGTKLGVAYLVSGSVQRAGDTVRIHTELVSTKDGRTMWTGRYDRPYKDLFALQDEMAMAISNALHVKLLSTQLASDQEDRPPSGNIDAYNFYLQGLKHWHDQDFSQLAESMTKAVHLDPGYALAWAYLSGAWSTVAVLSNEAPAVAREHMRESRLAADNALHLAPGLGAAHAALAYLQFYTFDHRGALAECRRAVQLAPRDGTVLNGCGFVLGGIGKLGEAIRLRERLFSIEPLFTVNYFQYAKLLAATGRLDEAEKYLRTSEEVAKPSPLGHLRLAVLRGDATAALEIARQASPHNRDFYMTLAAQIGPDRAAADKWLADMLADTTWVEQRSRDDNRYQIAQVYALRRDVGHTLEWLERSFAANPSSSLFLLADPVLLRFRDDPQFIAFCKKLGLPPPSESEALSIDQIRAAIPGKAAEKNPVNAKLTLRPPTLLPRMTVPYIRATAHNFDASGFVLVALTK